MKKKLSLVMAALLALSIGTTAMAAPSPSAEDTTILAEAVTVSEDMGTASELDLATITAANDELRNIFLSLVAQANGVETASFSDDGTIVLGEDGTPLGEADETEMLAAFDFAPAQSVLDEIAANGSAEVEFAVSSVKAGDNLMILHLIESSNTWEQITPSSVEDGVVKGNFTSFSPIVIVKMPASLTAEPVVTAAAAESSSNTTLIIALVAAAAVVVAVAIVYSNSKKSKAKKN